MPRVTTTTQWQIIGPAGVVGAPGSAGDISKECSRLNDAANTDEDRIRVTPYKVVKYVAPVESRIIIAGGRDFADWDLLCSQCDRFIAEHIPAGGEVTIISGTANGADAMGERYANARKYGLIRCPAKWDEVEGLPSWQVGRSRQGKPYNKRAGMTRNAEMANIATHAVVFWDGASAGTKHMAGLCKEMAIPHVVAPYAVRPPHPKVFAAAQMRIEL